VGKNYSGKKYRRGYTGRLQLKMQKRVYAAYARVWRLQ